MGVGSGQRLGSVRVVRSVSDHQLMTVTSRVPNPTKKVGSGGRCELGWVGRWPPARRRRCSIPILAGVTKTDHLQRQGCSFGFAQVRTRVSLISLCECPVFFYFFLFFAFSPDCNLQSIQMGRDIDVKVVIFGCEILSFQSRHLCCKTVQFNHSTVADCKLLPFVFIKFFIQSRFGMIYRFQKINLCHELYSLLNHATLDSPFAVFAF